MQKIKPGLLILILLLSAPAFSQEINGRVLSSETNSGIAYVNIGIIGKNTGTVTDENGGFTLSLQDVEETDSLKFSMIGYEPRSLSVGQFKEDSLKNVYLKTVIFSLKEVKVTYHRLRGITLGGEVVSNELRSGFAYNDLGSELGIMTHIRGRVLLKDINLNVAVCTYDSVTYRLNIYQSDNQDDFENILKTPIYISFSKDKINDPITVNLSKYSIVIGGNVLIVLELYKDLGEGRLLFHTEFFTGFTYHRKASEAKWSKAPGVIGMYLHGQIIKTEN